MIAVCGGLAVLLSTPLLTYREVASPDGEFSAVAKTALIRTFMPAMPGQAGDKPGSVAILRKDGKSCGSVPVVMVSMVEDVRWQLDGKPREANLVATATWNLDACTIEIVSR